MLHGKIGRKVAKFSCDFQRLKDTRTLGANNSLLNDISILSFSDNLLRGEIENISSTYSY